MFAITRVRARARARRARIGVADPKKKLIRTLLTCSQSLVCVPVPVRAARVLALLTPRKFWARRPRGWNDSNDADELERLCLDPSRSQPSAPHRRRPGRMRCGETGPGDRWTAEVRQAPRTAPVDAVHEARVKIVPRV